MEEGGFGEYPMARPAHRFAAPQKQAASAAVHCCVPGSARSQRRNANPGRFPGERGRGAGAHPDDARVLRCSSVRRRRRFFHVAECSLAVSPCPPGPTASFGVGEAGVSCRYLCGGQWRRTPTRAPPRQQRRVGCANYVRGELPTGSMRGHWSEMDSVDATPAWSAAAVSRPRGRCGSGWRGTLYRCGGMRSAVVPASGRREAR